MSSAIKPGVITILVGMTTTSRMAQKKLRCRDQSGDGYCGPER
jgi:hypothetical protein